MNHQGDSQQWQGSTGGEAAWKEERERVAARNEQARKVGKANRETHDRSRAHARDAAEARRRSPLPKPGRAR